MTSSVPVSLQGAARSDAAATAVAALVGASGAALCVVDGDGRCVAANAAFARALGVEGGIPAGTCVAIPDGSAVSSFDPGDGREWRLVSPPVGDPAGDPAAPVLRAIYDQIPAMINAKDAASRYLFMNAYQAALYGVRPEDAIGRTAAEMLGRGYGSYTRSLDREVLEHGRVIGFFDEEYAGVDGVVRDWLTVKAPLRAGADPADRVDGVVTMAIDITERHEREQALAVARRQAEDGARARARYLATVGHELRTPLHSIVGFSEFLSHESLGPLGSPTYREYITDILNAGRHLLDVVNDIMDMARIEAGRFTLDEDPVDLQRTVGDVLRMLALPIAHKGVVAEADVPADFPPLLSDHRRLRQILINLVGNAVKFTPAGGRVRISARVDEAGDPVLEVSDNGVGIAAEDQATALAPFGRVLTPGVVETEGSGLGLPLVKALVECHGGRFELDSKPGEGTSVRAVFPRYRLRPRP